MFYNKMEWKVRKMSIISLIKLISIKIEWKTGTKYVGIII
jgi:hypothetical protein